LYPNRGKLQYSLFDLMLLENERLISYFSVGYCKKCPFIPNKYFEENRYEKKWFFL